MSTILIVDDNKMNLQVLGNILNEQKYRVAMALDGKSALKLTTKIKPDLIVLDIMMPGMDGFEVCEILKSQDETSAIPIIFLTAKIDMEDIVKGFRLGGSDYLTKPFKKDELLVRIKSHLEINNSRIIIEQQAKELKALNEQKDKIFEVFASDIKNALDSLIEVPRLLANPKLNLSQQETTELMNDLHDKAEVTYDLLENIMWWSLSQRKQVLPQFSRINLLPLCLEIKQLLSVYAESKQIEILIDIEPDCTIIADQKLLQLVIKNILHNSLKYSNPKGTVHCNVSKNDIDTIILISDKGIGMKEETLKQIQDQYSYHMDYGTNNEKGSGIGLKISCALLKSMNGRIDIESKLGFGTIVSLSFSNEE